MTRRSNKAASPDVGDVAELQATIQSLIDHVACLTAAIDELADQLKWRNNNEVDSEAPAIPRFVLTSMPRDPAAREFAINRVPEKTIDRLRDEIFNQLEISANEPAVSGSSRRPAGPQQSLFD